MIFALRHKHGIATNFVGANDSGSSTGLLLELAQQLRTVNKLPTNILLAFLDGEECRVQYSPNDGLHGSRHLARTLVKDGRAKAVRAVIVIDMIGHRDLTLTIPQHHAGFGRNGYACRHRRKHTPEMPPLPRLSGRPSTIS